MIRRDALKSVFERICAALLIYTVLSKVHMIWWTKLKASLEIPAWSCWLLLRMNRAAELSLLVQPGLPLPNVLYGLLWAETREHPLPLHTHKTNKPWFLYIVLATFKYVKSMLIAWKILCQLCFHVQEKAEVCYAILIVIWGCPWRTISTKTIYFFYKYQIEVCSLKK